MRTAVLHDTPPNVTRPRRFGDAVSQVNDHIHDKARLLDEAIRMVDRLGLRILAVEADASASRNNIVQVVYGPACHALDGVEIARQPGFSIWMANRFGTEIRWVVPCEEAA